VSQVPPVRARVDPLGPLLAALGAAKNTPQLAPSRLGICGGVDAAGAVLVTFDGETGQSGRSYPRLASYAAPAAGDRVLLLRVGATWVVVGEVVGVAAVTPSSSSSSSSSAAALAQAAADATPADDTAPDPAPADPTPAPDPVLPEPTLVVTVTDTMGVADPGPTRAVRRKKFVFDNTGSHDTTSHR
jgi:hypothetical protein